MNNNNNSNSDSDSHNRTAHAQQQPRQHHQQQQAQKIIQQDGSNAQGHSPTTTRRPSISARTLAMAPLPAHEHNDFNTPSHKHHHATHKTFGYKVRSFFRHVADLAKKQRRNAPPVHTAVAATHLHKHTDEPHTLREKFREGLHKHVKPQLNFFRLHMIYFTTASLVGGALLSAIQPNLAFVDMLFLSTSAMTQTGLITVNFAQMKFGAQFLVYALVFIGGQVLMTLVPVFIRRFYFKGFTKRLATDYPDVLTTTTTI